VDLYLAFEVYTEQTIEAGWHKLANFVLYIKVYYILKNIPFQTLEAWSINGANKEFDCLSQNLSDGKAPKK
jgi:hypothetical protein